VTLDGVDEALVVRAEHGAETRLPGVTAHHLSGQHEKVVVDVAFLRHRDIGPFAIRAFHETDAATERQKRVEIVVGAIQVRLKAHTDIGEGAQRLAIHLERRVDVGMLLHVDPDEGVALFRVSKESAQGRAAARAVDVKSELGQLDGYVAVQSVRANHLQRRDVVVNDLIGLSRG
jgi:hypothetical protein